jgi:hypothetical protein
MDNPQAFPVDTRQPWHPGMSLRDYFAGQAVIVTTKLAAEMVGDAGEIPRIAAQTAYSVADAMLAERQRTPTPSMQEPGE